MKYISTRGGIEPVSFKEAVMMGLATDGGLLLPQSIPLLDRNTLKDWRALPYRDLAFRIISLFSDDIPAVDLKRLIDQAYDSFDHPDVTPTVSIGGVHIVELFHG